jgi:alpha-1,6-mannosyltransferase
MPLLRLVIVGVLMELCYVSFYFVDETPEEVLVFVGISAIAFLMLAYAMHMLRLFETPRGSVDRLPVSSMLQWITQHNSGSMVTAIIGFGIIFRLTLVLHDPVSSDDMYRYVWDGKVAAQGINPFALAPNDPQLTSLHTDDLPSRVNFPHMRTIYPPLAQVFFLVSHSLFGDSVAGMKLLLVLIEFGALAVLLLLLRHFNARPETVIVYAWSPLPILYFGLDGHIDALGIPLVLLVIYYAVHGKHGRGAVLLGLSALAKLYPLFVAPLLARVVKGIRGVWIALIPVGMLAIGCWLYLEPTGGLTESFLIFNSTWRFNGSVFEILYMVLNSNVDAHLASGVLFFLWLGFVFFVDRPFPEKIFLVFLGYIVISPVVHPWYLTWLAALLVIRWSLAVFVLLGLSTVSNIVVYQYQVSGVWQHQSMLLLVEYLPFYLLLAWEVVRGKFGVAGAEISLERSR